MPSRASRTSPSRLTIRPRIPARTMTPIPAKYITMYPMVCSVTPSRSSTRSGSTAAVP